MEVLDILECISLDKSPGSHEIIPRAQWETDEEIVGNLESLLATYKVSGDWRIGDAVPMMKNEKQG